MSVLQVTPNPGCNDRIANAKRLRTPRRVGADHLGHLRVERIALRALRKPAALPIELVELRVAEAREVGGSRIASVEELHEIVGDIGSLREARELKLARVRGLEHLRKRLDPEVELDAGSGKSTLPQFIVAAVLWPGERGHVQHEGFAVGELAKAVAVPIAIAEFVEERACDRGIVRSEPFEIPDVTGDIRRNGLSRDQSLSVAYDADLVAAVVGAADGTAERDTIGRIAANHVILHVEIREGHGELDRPLQLHALCRVFRQ